MAQGSARRRGGAHRGAKDDPELSNIEDITFAQGDVLYYNGTALVALSPGTSGHFLKTLGAAANPAWAAASGTADPLDGNAIIAQRMFIGRG